MNRSFIKAVGYCTLMMFATSATFAETGAALLYPNGAVLLNGNAVPGATALFRGDVVSTKDSSIASFNTHDSRVSITAQTTVKLEEKDVNLQNGIVTVDTKTGFATRAAKYKVFPNETNARYRVVRKGDQVLVASLEGPIVVQSGAKTYKLAAGSNWNSESDDASGSPQEQGPQPMPAGRMPVDHKKIGTGTLVLVGAGMGGLAIGLAVSASGSNPVSPVRP
jgi:hypothetical protein